MEKAILTCALTGVLTNPKQHPVPVTPAQMAAEARDAFNAGASIMHVHVRNQEEGNELRQGSSAGRGRVDFHNGRIPSQNQIARRAVWAASFQREHGAGGVGVDGAVGEGSRSPPG